MKKKLRVKKKFKNIFKIIIGLVLILFVFVGSPLIINTYKEEQKMKTERELQKKIEQEKKEKYNKCILEYNEEIDKDEAIIDLKTNISEYLKKYNVAVKYENLEYGYSYAYQENKVYYGASLIKLVDVLYLIDNEIDLSLTKKYTKNYIKGSSVRMDKRTIGEEVSLKDLITYVLEVSDNSAHFMLADYINKTKLKEYGQSLGAKTILTRSDYFGDQTVYDTNIYLKKLYDLLNKNKEKTSFIKEAMLNDYSNLINYKMPINVAHKYGLYSNYYHDIGIVYEEIPYALSVLTISNSNIRKELFSNIAKFINELDNKYIELTKEACHTLIYGDEL